MFDIVACTNLIFIILLFMFPFLADKYPTAFNIHSLIINLIPWVCYQLSLVIMLVMLVLFQFMSLDFGLLLDHSFLIIMLCSDYFNQLMCLGFLLLLDHKFNCFMMFVICMMMFQFMVTRKLIPIHLHQSKFTKSISLPRLLVQVPPPLHLDLQLVFHHHYIQCHLEKFRH